MTTTVPSATPAARAARHCSTSRRPVVTCTGSPTRCSTTWCSAASAWKALIPGTTVTSVGSRSPIASTTRIVLS